MEFYKQAKVLGLTANTTLNLDSAAYNHKGASFLCETSSQLINIQFYDTGALSTGITFTAAGIKASTGLDSLYDTKIIPARLARVTASAAGVTLILWN